MLSKALDVGDQVVRGVGREVDRDVTGVRRASSGAALVEQDDPVGRGIEVPAMLVGAPGPRAAVQDDGRLPPRIPADLPVHALASPTSSSPCSYGSISGYSSATANPFVTITNRPELVTSSPPALEGTAEAGGRMDRLQAGPRGARGDRGGTRCGAKGTARRGPLAFRERWTRCGAKGTARRGPLAFRERWAPCPPRQPPTRPGRTGPLRGWAAEGPVQVGTYGRACRAEAESRRASRRQARPSAAGASSRKYTRADGAGPGHAGAAHALGPRVVPAVRGVPGPPGADDGRAHRAAGRRFPSLPLGRADRGDRRLPGGAAGARTRYPPPGRRGEALGRPVGHSDGRVPGVGRVAGPEPGTGPGPGPGPGRRTCRGIPAGPVWARGADAADPGPRGDLARGGVAGRASGDRPHGVRVGIAGREPRDRGVPGLRVLPGRAVPRRERPARPGPPPPGGRGSARSHVHREPVPGDGGGGPSRAGPRAALPPGRGPAGGPRPGGLGRRAGRPPGRRGGRHPAGVAGRAALVRPRAPPAERVLGPGPPEAGARPGRGPGGTLRRAAGRGRRGVPRGPRAGRPDRGAGSGGFGQTGLHGRRGRVQPVAVRARRHTRARVGGGLVTAEGCPRRAIGPSRQR